MNREGGGHEQGGEEDMNRERGKIWMDKDSLL